MSDSFFTTRTSADLQFEGVSVVICETYLDACVRRIAKVEGPLEAAKKMQRLSDICSGVYVLPLDHWQKAAPKAAEPTPKPVGWVRGYLTDNTVIAFWIGFFFGFFISGGK